jgi:hypothetical protein
MTPEEPLTAVARPNVPAGTPARLSEPLPVITLDAPSLATPWKAL